MVKAAAASVGTVTDWPTIASLATAGGTLVLATATFASVRSANRAARVAERALLTGLRPLLVPSRLQDPEQKVMFVDDKALHVPGGEAATDVTDTGVYLALSLHNAGTGLAVLHGWHFYPERRTTEPQHPDTELFRRLTRDLYIAAGEVGFWQGAYRDPEAEEFRAAAAAITAGAPFTIDILYGDQEGGQRMISRFSMQARRDRPGWIASVGRHWNLDRGNPR